MKLGLLTAAFPTLTLEEVAQWAHDHGFEALEIASWPSGRGEHRRYAGVSHIDVEHLEPKRVRDVLRRYNLEISSLAYYPNNLDPDQEARHAANDHLRRVIEAAEELEVGIVGTFYGGDRKVAVADNHDELKQAWPTIGRFAAPLFAVCLGILTSYEPALAQTTASAQIDLLSGTGFPGYADGPADRATFLLPSALAFSADGTLYVADAAAQRIRAISPTGFVRTIAGGGELTDSGLWVDGGFRDGAAFSARFNRPYGIAVRPDGAIYVADTFNHCIRLIRSDVVSTIAGRFGTAVTADGPLHRNLMQYPRVLSVGADCSLYTADPKHGVRTLSRNGLLRTLPPPRSLDFKTATGIAATDSAGETQLDIANADQLIRYGVRSHTVFIDYDRGARTDVNLVQGGGPLAPRPREGVPPGYGPLRRLGLLGGRDAVTGAIAVDLHARAALRAQVRARGHRSDRHHRHASRLPWPDLRRAGRDVRRDVPRPVCADAGGSSPRPLRRHRGDGAGDRCIHGGGHHRTDPG